MSLRGVIPKQTFIRFFIPLTRVQTNSVTSFTLLEVLMRNNFLFNT